jgi:hypothetical protein
MIDLPTTVEEPIAYNPAKMVLYGHTKLGKTEALMQIPNSLLVDLENSSGFYKGMAVNVRKIADTQNITMLDALRQVIISLNDQKVKNSNNAYYDYLIIDSGTQLEVLAGDLALQMYKATPLGKNYTGTDITTLPQGAGWGLARTAFEKLYGAFEGLYAKGIILVCHIKSTSINKNGTELTARDIALSGKLKMIVAADADAISYMYRKQNSNENILSFQTSETDLATGSRSAHLSGKNFLISEKLPDGKLITHWDKIYLPELNTKIQKKK